MSMKITPLLFLFILLFFETSAQCNGADFEEQNGIVVIEMESGNLPSGWNRETGTAGYTGTSFIAWRGSDYFGSPGNGLIEYKVKINSPGIYRFQWRNKVGIGSDGTEHNDSWLKFPDAFDFFAQNGNSIKYPVGGSFKKSNVTVMGNSSGGWMKIYNSGGASSFNWTSFTSDNDGHKVYAEFTTAGTYTIQVSGRSNGHFIDRMVLYKESSYSESSSTDISRVETTCGGGGGPDCSNLSLSLDAIGTGNCNGSDGSINSSVSGAQGSVGYSWSNGATTANITGLSPGNYSLTITDQQGCSRTSSATINEPATPNVSFGSIPDISESDNAFTLTGGSPSGGTYSGQGINNNIFDPTIGPGTYSITYTYTDSNTQCTNSASSNLTVTESTACNNLVLTLNFNDITICGGNDGTISSSVSGAQGSVSYSWSNGDNSASISNLAEGNYTLTITDQQGCTKSSSVNLQDPTKPNVSLNTFPNVMETDISFALTGGSPAGGVYSGTGVLNGIFDPSIGVGTYSLNYTYTNAITNCSESATQNITVDAVILPAQTISFTLINADSDSDIATITSGKRFVLSALPTTNLSIRANIDPEVVGSVFMEITGPINDTIVEEELPYSIFGNNSGDYAGRSLPIGNYTIKAIPYSGIGQSGVEGLDLIIDFTISEESIDCSGFIIAVNTTDVSQCNENNGTAVVEVTGGQGLMAYNWSSGGNAVIEIGLAIGTYSVTVSDDNGCSQTTEFTVEENIILPDVSLDSFENVTTEDVAFALVGGVPLGGEYSGEGVTNGMFNPTEVGVGTFTITYTYSDQDTGCSNFSSQNIEVLENGTLSLPTDSSFIFPNPIIDRRYTLKIPGQTTGILDYSIFSNIGKEIISGKMDAAGTFLDFDLSQLILPAGLYHMVIEGGSLNKAIAISFLSK